MPYVEVPIKKSAFGMKCMLLMWQVLIGWGGDTVVVSCRGTASFRNALSDIQVPTCTQ